MAKKSKLSIEDVKVILPVARLAFPHLDKPHAFENENEEKYKARLLFDTQLLKNDEKQKKAWKNFRDICKKVAFEHYETSENFPDNFDWGIRDGNKKADLPGHQGCFFINTKAKADKKPQLVDQNPKIEIEWASGRMYAGCFVKALIIPYHYNVGGNCGIGFALKALQYVAKGESLASKGMNASSEFAIIENEESNDLMTLDN